jgi:hypothetical protein
VRRCRRGSRKAQAGRLLAPWNRMLPHEYHRPASCNCSDVTVSRCPGRRCYRRRTLDGRSPRCSRS